MENNIPEELRAFNDAGRERWQDFINALGEDPSLPFDETLLGDPEFTKPPTSGSTIPIKRPSELTEFDKLELATVIQGYANTLKESGMVEDAWPGVWDWLAAYYFDLLCPLGPNGKRKLMQKEWYVFSRSFQRQYKHRIAGPALLVELHGDQCALLLISTRKSLTPGSASQLEDEIASRKDIISSTGMMSALNTLYWDPEGKSSKRGAVANTKKAGTIRRFADIVMQLERTFDTQIIGGEEIVKLLPQKEFSRWLK